MQVEALISMQRRNARRLLGAVPGVADPRLRGAQTVSEGNAAMRALLRLTVIAFLVAAPLPGCGPAVTQTGEQQPPAQENSAEDLLRKGQASARIGDMTRAEQYFVLALKAGGDERKILSYLLKVCVADQRYPVALEYAEQYLRKNPRDLDVQFAAASIHAALGDAARARSMLEQVVRDDPERSEAHYALATLLRSEGQALQLADIHDLEYLRLNPNGPLAERARARLSKATP